MSVRVETSEGAHAESPLSSRSKNDREEITSKLKQKLEMIKDYSSWKKSKIKRINLCDFTTFDCQNTLPALQTILSYGKNGSSDNAVIVAIIEDAKQQLPPVQSTDDNQFQRIMSKHHTHKQQQGSPNPSFVAYKKDNQQRSKIIKTVQPSPRRQQRVKTEQISKHPQLPKELIRLKTQLLNLPSLQQRNQQRKQKSSLLNDQETIEVEDVNPQTPMVKNIVLSKETSSVVGSECARQRHKRYVDSIHDILKKSIDYAGDSLQTSSHSSAKGPSFVKKKKGYWPKYDECGLSAEQVRHDQRVEERFIEFMQSSYVHPNFSSELVRVILRDQREQEDQIEREAIRQERSNFWERYDHKMRLELANYKKNMKEFVQCKKAYRIEKQRQQIRANGLKRLKKVHNSQLKKKPSVVPES